MPPPTEALLPFRWCIRRPRTTDQLLRNSCHSYGLPLAFLGKSPELSVSSPASRDWRYSDSPRSWTIRLRRPDRNLRIVDLFTFEFDFSFKPKLLAPIVQAMNDLKAQLSNIDSTSFSSLVLIETGPTFFGMIIASRYLKTTGNAIVYLFRGYAIRM